MEFFSLWDSASGSDAMAQMKDIPTSTLAIEGTEVKTGLLSIVEKKINMLKSSKYQLNPLYWRLVSYVDQTYLLGYSKEIGGAKAIKKLLVKGCSIEMNPPEKVVVSPHSNESFLCIQCGQKIIFLKAENKHQRNKWVDAIRSATKEPIYSPSTVSTSLDTSEHFVVLHNRDQRLPMSVHNTADTAPRPGAEWRRVNTTPVGQFEMTHRVSLSSIPSTIASAMAVQDYHHCDDGAMLYAGRDGLRDYYTVPVKPLSVSTSTNTSQPPLRVQDVRGKLYYENSCYRRSGTETKALHQAESHCGVYEPGYEEIDDDEEEDPIIHHINELAYEPVKSDDEEEYFLPPSPSDMPDENFYMPLRGYDDQSSVSRVNNLGLESGGIYEDTSAPKLPKRDYQKPTSVVQEGLVKKTSSKSTRAPQPYETPIDQMVYNQREKTVCLETQFQRDQQPIGRDKSNDDNEKEMRGKMNTETPNGESLHAYVQRFRSELFQIDGVIVEVDKTDLSPQTMKLMCVAECICIAALPSAKLHSLLHIDDVIVNVNRQTLPSIDFCYKLFRTTVGYKVQLLVKRVMHGILCHVILSAYGNVDSLGLEFGNQSHGNEVTAMHGEGLVAKSGSPARPKTLGVVNGGMLVNWGLVEINKSPVSFDSSPADVRDQIQHAGCELALVFMPMDIISVFKERPRGESNDETSVCAAGGTTEAEKNDYDNLPENAQSDGTDSVEPIDHVLDSASGSDAMAHMRDISTSILATEGTEVKTGVLSILERQGIKMLKSSGYQLKPLYWRLVSYVDQTYLLGYSKQIGGAKAIKKLLVKGFSIEMNLPEKVVVSPDSKEMFLGIQCEERNIFLKADSKRQRNKWEYAIHSALSTVSKTSTHSSDYYEVFSPGVVPEPPRRVRNTPYTAPRPKAVWKGAQTNSAGRLQMANRAYRSSIPASAQALAQQNQRSQEMASPKVLQSQQLDNHSLNSAEGMRSSSLREPNKSAIFDDSAKHVGLEVVEDNKHFEVSPSNPLVLSTSTGTNQPNLRVQDPVPRTLYTQKSRYTHSGTETKALHQAENSCDIIEPSYEQIEKDPIMPHPSPPEMPVENRTRYDYDSESCLSRMNNLGLESEGNANDFLFDDTTAPGPPKQDYQNPTSVVQEGLAKRKSCKKTRAPKPPEGPVDPINSIQRRNPVCLETQFHQPKGRDKSDDDNEKEMRGKMNGEATNDESIHEYIQGTTEADLPEKAQSDGTDSVEPIDHDLDGRSATGNFGALGGKLSTKSHGLTLSIPPGALEEGEKISLIVLTDIPEGLTLNTDELLVSHGFQCYPSGLRFKKPAKLIIPHCALVTTPNNIKTILYSWNQSGTPKRLSDPDNIICSVQERWLEVSITHFSGGFIALIRDWLFLKGILLSCMSFLPRFMPPSRRPVLEVRFVKKPHNQKWKDVHTLDDPGFRPVKGDDDEIILQKGTLRVTCQLGEKGPKSDVPTIQDSNMMLETKVTGYIMLNLTEKSDDTLVTLEVVHTSTQTIKFNTRFQGIGERFKEQDTPSPSNVEIPSDEQIVTDANILNLARLLPPNLWSPLYVALHIDHSIAEGIREKYTEIPEQYIHLLQKWRAALTRTRTDLNAILIQVEAGGLVNKYVD